MTANQPNKTPAAKKPGALKLSASALHEYASAKRKGMPKTRMSMASMMERC